jgi:hypothetical protein
MFVTTKEVPVALARTTVANYKVRLKRLREILPLIVNDEKKKKCLLEIESLTTKLGKEMTDLEIQLTRGPGRPKLREDYTEEFALAKKLREAEELKGITKEGPDFTKEGIERRAKELRNNPVTLVEEVQRSADELQALISTNIEADAENKERMRLEELANEELAKKGTNATS